MFDVTRFLVRDSRDLKVAEDCVIAEEGLPLVQLLRNGEEVVAISGYEGAKRFIGFSYGESMYPHNKSDVEEFTITGTRTTHTLILGRVPFVGQIRVVDTATGVAFTEGGTQDEVPKDNYFRNGSTLYFSPENSGATVRIFYRYAPQPNEVKFMDVTKYTFNTASEEMGRIGVILSGEIFTDKYDPTIAWDALGDDDVLLAGENGTVTAGTADEKNIAIPGYVTATPTVDSPYLGIRFDVH